jgi:D-beta-D-heptose 7-phosphate kinase/D-beta-D-heptose 1-phosphate adenosyltransferase
MGARIKTNRSFLEQRGRHVKTYEDLAEIVNALRIIGAKIVLTQGTFDFIHIGHFLYLEKAHEYGDVLVVGVDSDEKVKERKGPDRPIVDEQERIDMLTHVRHVDFVTLKPKDAPKWELIKLLRPDVLIATKETYTPEQVKKLQKYCGEVVVLQPQATTSTSAKVRRLNLGLSKKMRDTITKTINDTFESMLKDA